MNKRLKLALAALLGFSTACTSVRNAPKDDGKQPKDADTTVVRGGTGDSPRVIVMYGVRVPDSVRLKRMERLERQRPDSLPPVAEQPGDDTPSSGRK